MYNKELKIIRVYFIYHAYVPNVIRDTITLDFFDH